MKKIVRAVSMFVAGLVIQVLLRSAARERRRAMREAEERGE